MTANDVLRQTLNKAGFITQVCEKCGQEYCDFPGLHSDRVCGYCAAGIPPEETGWSAPE